MFVQRKKGVKMTRLGPQVKKLFEISSRKEKPGGDDRKTKKYTFILPVALMREVKHTAIETDSTISDWLADAIEKTLKERRTPSR